CARYDGYLDYW
nr:immunoglobulin heavy chain junction region [Mus musculus]